MRSASGPSGTSGAVVVVVVSSVGAEFASSAGVEGAPVELPASGSVGTGGSMATGHSTIVPFSMRPHALPFDEALARVTEELQRQGFGVLSTIDVRDVFRAKLGAEFKRYTILGACNPSFAMKGLKAEEALGLLMPCNVTLSEHGETTTITAFDPMLMASVLQSPSIIALAADIRAGLERSLLALPRVGAVTMVPA